MSMTCSPAKFVFTCAVVVCVERAAAEVVIDRPIPSLSFGRNFRSELSKPLTASWHNVDVRSILRRVTQDRNLAILLDRRIDPTQELVVDINDQSVLQGVQTIAKLVSAHVSVVGNTLYVGSPRVADKLRTLIELRAQELFQLTGLPSGRRFELAKRKTAHWNDLERPIDLIQRIATRYALQVEGLHAIPHDLWAGSTLPNVSAAEALSLILVQFDCTFVWTGRAAGIKIVSIPESVSFEKSYAVGLRSPSSILQMLVDRISGLQGRAQGRRIVIRGTSEQHEAAAKLLRPRTESAVSPKASGQKPLRLQSFTLKLENASVKSLMKRLEAIGVVFKYDKEQLNEANIDMNQKISLDVTKDPAIDFFERVFGPLGLDAMISDWTVTLRPSSPPQ